MLVASTCELVNREAKLSGVTHYNGREFAGSLTCTDCHPAIAEAYSQTPHHQTSAHADTTTVRGKFNGRDTLFQLNERFTAVMRDTSVPSLSRKNI